MFFTIVLVHSNNLLPRKRHTHFFIESATDAQVLLANLDNDYLQRNSLYCL